MNCHSASIMVCSGQGRTSRELSFQVTAGKVHILVDAVITETVGRGFQLPNFEPLVELRMLGRHLLAPLIKA